MKKAILQLNNVSVVYPGGYNAISSASFILNSGDRLCIIGDCRSGKTSLLKAIGGLEKITNGVISYDGKNIDEIAICDRNFALSMEEMLPRNKSVYSILAYPMKLRKLDGIAVRINEIAKQFAIDCLLNHKVKDLNTMQLALLNIARMFVVPRDLYMLDNPLGALKHSERSVVINDIVDALDRVDGTIIFATDSLNEALRLGYCNNAILSYCTLSKVAKLNNLYFMPDNLSNCAIISSGNCTKLDITENNGYYLMGIPCKLPRLIGNFSDMSTVVYHDEITMGIGEYNGCVTSVKSTLRGLIYVIETVFGEVQALSDKVYAHGEKVLFSLKNGIIRVYDNVSEKLINKL